MAKQIRTRVLLQSQIEHAMKVTRSNRAAAEYLRVTYRFYKRFAMLYKNKDGVSLFDVHKNQSGSGIAKGSKGHNLRHNLDEIILGKHPTYPSEKLIRRLVANGYLVEKCNMCGFSTKRPTDFRTPLLLHHINGNKTDHRLDNLEILCYNCYYVHIGDIPSKYLKNQPMENTNEIVRSSEDASREGIDSNTFDVLTDEEKMELIKGLENL